MHGLRSTNCFNNATLASRLTASMDGVNITICTQTAMRRPVLRHFPTCVSDIAQQNNVNTDHTRPQTAHRSLFSYLELQHCYYTLFFLPSFHVIENKSAQSTKDNEEPYSAGNLPESVACRVRTRFRYSCEGFLNNLHFLHKFYSQTAHTAVGISDVCNVHNTKYPVGARFFAHVQTGPGVHPASCTIGTGSFPGVKRPGLGADHPPPSSAEVTNE
jgi:hypothetical protein